MTIKELDPIIKAVAEEYGFEISYLENLDRVVIKDKEMGCEFFWDSSHSKQNFFSELKDYFEEVGGQGCWS